LGKKYEVCTVKVWQIELKFLKSLLAVDGSRNFFSGTWELKGLPPILLHRSIGASPKCFRLIAGLLQTCGQLCTERQPMQRKDSQSTNENRPQSQPAPQTKLYHRTAARTPGGRGGLPRRPEGEPRYVRPFFSRLSTSACSACTPCSTGLWVQVQLCLGKTRVPRLSYLGLN
jgi:hypothetical protein